MKHENRQHNIGSWFGSWFAFCIVIGTALGVVTGDLVWWLSGAIVLGFIAEVVRSRSRVSNEKKSVRDNV